MTPSSATAQENLARSADDSPRVYWHRELPSGFLLEVVRDLAPRFVRVVDRDPRRPLALLDGVFALGSSPARHLERLGLPIRVFDRDFFLPPIDVRHDSLSA